MKRFSDFIFVKESTPTEVVQDFIYTTMRGISDIQENLQNAIADYLADDEPNGMKFGLQVAEADRKLKWLADTLEVIYNHSVRNCKKQTQEGGAE